MRLFSDRARTKIGPMSYAGDTFSYYDSSARPEVEAIRSTLDEWFAHYPAEEQPALRQRFLDAFDAAFFELLLHELLLRFGFKVTVHPDLQPSTPRRPDFLAEGPGGERFILEAVLATGQSKGDEAKRRVRDFVLDAINRTSLSAFMLDVDIVHWPSYTPSYRAIKDFIRECLSGLEPDDVTARHGEGGWEAIPRYVYRDHQREDRCEIVFRPIPVRSDKRGEPGRPAIGVLSEGEAVQLRSAEELRDALARKVSQYGQPQLPYVIAVNGVAEYRPELDDLVEALIGDTAVAYGTDGTIRELRQNGLWGPSKNTRVSAVMFTISATPWDLTSAPAYFCRNPWASIPCGPTLSRLPQLVIRDGEAERVEGVGLGELLGLPAGWPRHATE